MRCVNVLTREKEGIPIARSTGRRLGVSAGQPSLRGTDFLRVWNVNDRPSKSYGKVIGNARVPQTQRSYHKLNIVICESSSYSFIVDAVKLVCRSTD